MFKASKYNSIEESKKVTYRQKSCLSHGPEAMQFPKKKETQRARVTILFLLIIVTIIIHQIVTWNL